MTRDTSPRWSVCSIRPRKSPPTSRSTARWPRACARGGWTEFVGPGAPARRGLGAARLARVRHSRTRWCSTARPAPARRRSPGSPPSTPSAAFEELSAVNAGRAEVREVIARARERRARRPARDDLLPRRDPPLQQGPAGRAAARGRGGAADADRGDDGEPLLRGQLRAALARPGLRAAGARRRGSSRGCCGARWSAAPARASRSPTRSSPSSPCARAATRGRR